MEVTLVLALIKAMVDMGIDVYEVINKGNMQPDVKEALLKRIEEAKELP